MKHPPHHDQEPHQTTVHFHDHVPTPASEVVALPAAPHVGLVFEHHGQRWRLTCHMPDGSFTARPAGE